MGWDGKRGKIKTDKGEKRRRTAHRHRVSHQSPLRLAANPELRFYQCCGHRIIEKLSLSHPEDLVPEFSRSLYLSSNDAIKGMRRPRGGTLCIMRGRKQDSNGKRRIETKRGRVGK